MTSIEKIREFIQEQTGVKNSFKNTDDLDFDLGVYGDDMFELVEKYSEEFDVDISEFLWYFHTGEEGFSGIGGLISNPPNKLVAHIPITANLLLRFANEGSWNLKYPAHSVPDKRVDLAINKYILILFLLIAIILLVWN